MPNERSDFFTRVYRENLWNNDESRSGHGSGLDYTRPLIESLPAALRSLEVSRLLDLPCGDFHWMKNVDLTGIDYVGGDIVSNLAEANNATYGSPSRQFVVLDIVKDLLPPADMVFVRDCFIHFSNALIFDALKNIARSDIRYLCTTTLDAAHYQGVANVDLDRTQHGVNFEFRPILFEAPPFSFPPPVQKIRDDGGGTGSWRTVMGVWEVATLRDLPRGAMK